MNSTGRPLCAMPWHSIIISEERYDPCCNFSFSHPGFPANAQKLKSIYNSPQMQEVRQRLVSGDLKGSPCATCIRGNLHSPEFPEYATKADPAFRSLLDSARQEFEQGAIAVSHPPMRLFVTLYDVSCNLRCRMCSIHGEQQSYTHIPESTQEFLERVKALYRSLGWEGLAEVSAFGGEPLFAKGPKHLWDFFFAEAPDDVALFILSNGTLLHKYLEEFKRFEEVTFHLSVDGYGEEYDAVRIGSTWPRIQQNLDNLGDLLQQKPGWKVQLQSVFMPSTLSSLPDLLRYAAEKGFSHQAQPVKYCIPDENFYLFSGLLEDMPWRSHLDEAMAVAAGMDEKTLLHLETRKKELELLHDEQGHRRKDVFFSQDLVFAIQDRERSQACSDYIKANSGDRPLALLGLTTFVCSFLLWAQKEKLGLRFEKVALPMAHRSTAVAGIPIVSPEELADFEGDVYLVCYSAHIEAFSELVERHLSDKRVFLLNEDVITAGIDELVAQLQDRPVVVYGAGGFARTLLQYTTLRELNIVAASDGNEKLWGETFLGHPILPPKEIPGVAADVVICSRAFEKAIYKTLRKLHGDALNVHRLYCD